MRTCLSLVLTLALAMPSVAHAGWSPEQRATLDAIIKLENAATKLTDAGELATALATVVERYEQEFARADVPNGYRRTVAKRGKAAALALFERTTDPGHLCSALELLRVYATDLVESEQDRLEIPNEVAELEARAVTVSAPCAAARAPEPTEAASTPTPPPEPQQPAATVAASSERQEHAAQRPPRRSRGQIVGGVSLFGVALGLGGGAAACFAGRATEQAQIAALDQRATEAGRKLTEDDWSRADAANGRYARLSNTGKALGVFAGISFIAAVILLAVPPRPTAKLRARAVGGGVRIEF